MKSFAERFKDKIIGLALEMRKNIIIRIWNMLIILSWTYVCNISKNDANAPVGPSMIATLKNINPSLPMVAIGGITEDNIEPIAQNGADGVSVISAIARSHNIDKTVTK